mgnify:CR=1 FL=1
MFSAEHPLVARTGAPRKTAAGMTVFLPPQRPQHGIVINLLTLGRLHMLPGEVRPVLQHRHMLVIYLITLFILVGVDTNGAASSLPIEMRGIIYMAAIGTAILVVAIFLQGGMAIAARRGQTVALHLSPVLFIATLCSVIVGESLFRALVPPEDPSLLRLSLLLAFHYLISELAAAILAHSLLPMILCELRGLPIRKLVETDPTIWTPDAPLPEAAPVEGFLTIADRSFPLVGLVHLQADGNYVHLWAVDQNALLPGPLADLVRQLPLSLGRQVHRSHWVAASALRDWRIDGREITLRLSNGKEVAVAVTRRREMRDWLVALHIPQTGAA